MTIFAPAKLNLFLAITGRRPDGFHELVSLVAPLGWGDELTVAPANAGQFTLACSDPAVPVDDSNLVLKAARAFAEATGWTGGAHFELTKRIPMGAGLGGGSSNGVAALRGLNALAGSPLSEERLRKVAETLGSDCPLFLAQRPVVMRGRGERIELCTDDVAARLRGRRVLLFKPDFGISTVWAYRRLAELAAAAPAASAVYLPADEAERRLAAWRASNAPAEALLYNTLERPAFEKHLALPTLLQRLRDQFGLAPRMTGSGSACFALLPDDVPVASVRATLRDAWGISAFITDTVLA